MIPGGAISIVRSGSILFVKGFGYADYSNIRPVDVESTLFQIGSVGKILTAMSVLRLAEQGKLDLNRDIKIYLDDFPLDESFQSPITVKHLLTHTAGFDDRVIGYAAKTKQGIKPLEQHLKERMPGCFQEAGKSVSYSNYSYALAGLIVENVSGMSFTKFVERNLLSSLRMDHSTYDLPGNDRDSFEYAKGHIIRNGEFVKQPLFYTHTKPAGGLCSSASDMTNLMMMLLNDGVFQGEQLLQKESIEMMFQRQFSNHPNLTGYTLGFEEQSFNGYPAVAKGGQTLGFVSALLLFPEQRIGVFITTNVNADDFIEMFMQHFTRSLFKADEGASPSIAEKIEVNSKRFAGTYRSNRYNHHTVEDFVALFRGSFFVRAIENSTLTSFHSDARQEYKPISPRIFQNTKNNHDFLIFKENESGQIVEMYRNATFAGLSVPLSYEKVSWYSSPHFVNEFLSFLVFLLMTSILIPLLLLVIFLIRLKKKDFWQKKSMPKIAHLSAFLFGILATIYTFGYVARVNHLGLSLVFGIPDALLRLNYIPFILILLLLHVIYSTFRIWSQKSAVLLTRLYYTGYSFSAIIFLGFLYNWHFIGFHI
jgi:CubicO group peptidase (beta-lactamase class C family)